MSCNPNLRKRQLNEIETENSPVLGPKGDGDGDDSEEDPQYEDTKVEELVKLLPQASDKTTKTLDSILALLPPKWRNWIVRGIFAILMISGFGLIIRLGPLALLLTTLLVQVKCFQEIISIGYAVYRMHSLPWFRSLSWYFLITSNYFFYGESLTNYFGVLLSQMDLMESLITYHRFISFTLYIIGFIWFVLSLVKKYYIRQFSLIPEYLSRALGKILLPVIKFAWTHVTLLIVVTQSYLILQNMFEGLIWFIVPVSMVICNDVMAYVFGSFFGKTPLIKLSPKKTWEGFIGGGIATVIFGIIISHVFCQYKYFVCPIEYSEVDKKAITDCIPSQLFQATQYNLPSFIGLICQMVGLPDTIVLYPFVLHSLALSLFSSIIGPFGGFFASGFKRAFKIKDFGDIIPGHGGIMDRFDCQYLIATFVNVYIHSFIRAPNAQILLQKIYLLQLDEQLQIFHSLNETLLAKGIL